MCLKLSLAYLESWEKANIHKCEHKLQVFIYVKSRNESWEGKKREHLIASNTDNKHYELSNKRI